MAVLIPLEVTGLLLPSVGSASNVSFDCNGLEKVDQLSALDTVNEYSVSFPFDEANMIDAVSIDLM